MAEKRLIDANELEEKAIYITGPKGSACHAVPLGLIQAAPTIDPETLRPPPHYSPAHHPWICTRNQRRCVLRWLQSLPWLGVRCSRYRVFQVLPLLRGQT